MAANLFKGPPLEAAFRELFEAVLDVANKSAKFNSFLNRLQITLFKIKPLFDEIEKLNQVLGRRKEETDMFVIQLKNGEELVRQCARIQWWNIYKKVIYSKKLVKLDDLLLRFFQIDVQALISMNSRKILVGVKGLNGQMDQVLSILTNGGGGNSSGFLGLSGGVGFPDLVVGLDVAVEELKVMVLEGSAAVVVVSGPGGCGKTTLAKMLCCDDEIKGTFGDNIFFVTVSKTPNLKVIVQKLLQHKGHHQLPEFQSDEDAINQLEHLLRQIGPDPILLILDDVWTEWESLVQKFMFQISGYKILVTSRFVFPGFDSIYELNLLTDQDAMTLFRHSAFTQHGSSHVSDDLVNKIVIGCKGCPLALTVVGQSLRGRPEVFWRSILKKWSEGQSIFESNNDVLVCLKTSLDALDEMVECYLDLGSFPEDQKIPATALMDMWVELYNLDQEGMGTISNLFELSTRNLVNLVPKSKDASEVDGYCNGYFVTQHDLLRELAIHQSSQEPIEQRKRLIMDISGNDLPKWWVEQMQQPILARLLSISTDEMFSSSCYNMELPKIEVLILNFRTRDYMLPQFMERLAQLKVLIVTYYGFCRAELNNFPLLGYLSNLRRIRLQHVFVPPLSTSLLQMRNLEKISLIMCEIDKAFDNCTTEVPRILPNLVEIEIDNCHDLVELPVGLCNVVHLKKLSITYCSELVSLPEEFGRLTNMEVLRLHSCTKLVKLPDSVGSLNKLRFLDVSYCSRMSILPVRMGELRGLRTIHMIGCSVLCELPPSVRDLQLLEDVRCDEVAAHLWEFYENYFTNLKINVVKEDVNLNWLHNLRP